MSRVSVTAKAHREGRLWVIEIAGYGVTQAERRQDISTMAGDYVACMSDIDPGLVDVQVTVDLPVQVAEAKAAREAADAANAAAATKTRVAVQDLQRQGWQVKEIAEALGVTPGRVSQISSSAGRRIRGGAASTGRIVASATSGAPRQRRSGGLKIVTRTGKRSEA